MKIKYTQTSTFEELQKTWNRLADTPSQKSAFKLFENAGYDEKKDILTVKHPDIESDTPVVRGTVRVKVIDRTCKAQEMKNPTWADLAKFFTENKCGEQHDLSRVELTEVTEGPVDKRVTVKELQLKSFA
jgi:hypothetical protein